MRITVDPEGRQSVEALCDIALKKFGNQAYDLVTQIYAALKDEPSLESTPLKKENHGMQDIQEKTKKT